MKDFQGFRFGQIHTKDLHLIVVSTSSRFVKNLLPSNTDYSVDVPGGNGKYYFGSTFGVREFTVNIAFEDIDEITWRRLSQIFSNDKPQDLVFDENPYKTYRAKIKQKPDFKYVCFRNENTGERVYKGEGTLNFICYHPLAFCFNKYIVRAADYYNVIEPKEIIEKSFETDFDKTVERSKDIV
jgi:predicted phage tail component-like protein